MRYIICWRRLINNLKKPRVLFQGEIKMNHKNILIILLALSIFGVSPAIAQIDPPPIEPAELADVSKFLGAAIAFSTAAIGAGLAVGKAGSAGLAAAAERPELRTTAIIITALGEAIAIYGIVVAILILGN